MPATNEIYQSQTNSSEVSQPQKSNKNILILILVILIVGLLGILIGLLAFLLTSRNNNQTVTTNSNSSLVQSLSSTTTLTNTSVTTITSSNTTATSNSNNSTSVSNSTTGSSVSFSHNEGKYIRFDYPTGWKVDVQGKTGTINSFDDIGYIRIQNDNGYSLWLNLMGGLGCTSAASMIDSANTNQAYNYSNPDDIYFNTNKKFPRTNFSAKKLNMPSSKNIYLTSFSFVNEIPPYKTKSITQLMSLDNGIYNEYACGFTTLDKLNFNSDYKIFSIGVPKDQTISQDNLATIIERFTNSFEKK